MDEYNKRMFLILIHILEKHSVYVVGRGGDHSRMGAKWLFAERGSSCCAVCIRRDSSQPSVQFAPILEWSPLWIFSLHCAPTGGSVGGQRGIAWLPEP